MPLFHVFFGLSGRIRRRDYWLYSILIMAGAFTVNYAAFRVWGHGPGYIKGLKLAEAQSLGPFLLTVYIVNMLGALLRLPVSIKRWHDRNRPAWIAFLLAGYWLSMQGVAIIFHVTDIRHAPLAYNVLSWIGVPLSLWTLIECGILDGTKGPNPYGPSPKTPVAQAEVF